MAGMLLLTVFLIFANGFFVAAEFALVKVRSSQLEVAAEDGSRMASVARGLLDHLDNTLSATQLGITITSLGLGWIGEPAVAKALGPLFHLLHVEEELAHKISVVVGFTLISFLHIVVGEVAPKSLAIARPVGVSSWVSVPMRAFTTFFTPALWVLNGSSNMLLRLFGIEPANTHSLAVPAEELLRIAQDSAAHGHISSQQGDLVSNVFTFTHRVAREIMVPRNRVHGIDLSEPPQEQIATALDHGHSRYPVFDGDMDDLVGVLHLKDLLRHRVEDMSPDDVRELCRSPLCVPESVPAETLMRQMQVRRTHLAMVIDEHGGVAGVVTLEDALEELVGDIQDEYDAEREPVEAIDGGFALEGNMLLEELAELLEVDPPASDADTLQGWLMEKLQRLPRPGDEVALHGWTLRVVTMERRALTRVEAHRPAATDVAPAGRE